MERTPHFVPVLTAIGVVVASLQPAIAQYVYNPSYPSSLAQIRARRGGFHPGPRRTICNTLVAIALALFSQVCFGVTYTYTIAAQSGQNGITSILGGPSINARTNCAFPVQRLYRVQLSP